METDRPEQGIEEQPAPTRKAPTLIVMVGPPGTGKSHLVRLLAQKVPLKVVETDEIRRQLTPHPEYTALENRKVFHIAHRKIDRLLRQGKDVVFDATNIYERGRRTLYRMAESDGAKLLIVRTLAPDEVVQERLRGRMAGVNPADRSEADWEVYLRMKRQFEEIGRPHMVVDSSRDLDWAVEEIVQFIRGEA
ncbi:MAG: AAA family ATPase [Chloroflexota bacterium]